MRHDLAKRKRLRLEGYDYSSPGYYHIILVTNKRQHFLGNFERDGFVTTDFGKVVQELLSDFSDHNPGVEILKYEIMPDHLHLLVKLFEVDVGVPGASIPEIVSKIKTLSVWIYNKKTGGLTSLPQKVWQRSYYDHILRSNEEAKLTFGYIEFNPDQFL